jgi:CRISPR-associated protein Cas2
VTIIIAKNLCDYTRGILKRWFLEPRANIFVSSINNHKLQSILKYINKHNVSYECIVLSTDSSTQGFKIIELNTLSEHKNIINNSSVSLVKKLITKNK